jgi:hypothetical protein
MIAAIAAASNLDLGVLARFRTQQDARGNDAKVINGIETAARSHVDGIVEMFTRGKDRGHRLKRQSIIVRMQPATVVWRVRRQGPKLRALKGDLALRAEPIRRTKWLPTRNRLRGSYM